MTAVEAADGSERLEWLLLTTLPVAGEEQAREILKLYALRWRIEDWHRMLKTGCEVEKIAHATAERVKRAVAINAAIAWMLAALTLMGRDTPELSTLAMLDEAEIAILFDYARTQGFPVPARSGSGETPELAEISLGSALLLVACLGGYLNRKHDRPPGHQVVWEGYARMVIGAQTMDRVLKIGPDSAIHKINIQSKSD